MHSLSLKSKGLVLLCVVAACCGCHTKKAIVAPAPTQEVAQADTTIIPLFPAEVLYIIGREWECLHDSTSAKYLMPRATKVRVDSISMADYIEQRLLELYPERAYPGYVAKVEQMAKMLIYAGSQSQTISNRIGSELPSPSAYYSAQDIASIRLSSDSVEIRFLELSKQEATRWAMLNRLATQANWMQRVTLDSLALSSIEEENLGLTIMLWKGPRMFYRIYQSKERATHLAEYYYPGATHEGKRGDAFRHIFVNAMLRTYVGLPMTYLTMDLYWEYAHLNAPCDRYMDLHNNVVGRQAHYSDFVYSEPSDLPSWEQWAEHVRSYIEDTTANGRYQDWNLETPSFIVIPQAEAVEKGNYIYFGK